jgi:hypothetical protein
MSLADRLADTSRLPVATVRLNGARWADWLVLSRAQSYGSGISGGAVEGRNPPVRPAVGMPLSWSWGYARPDGTGRAEIDGFNGVVSEVVEGAYPQRVSVKVADPLWKADRQQKDIATTPLNSIAASAAVRQILAGAGVTRLSIPALPASGSAWAGGEWVLGTLTPVSFPNSTALAAVSKICETLGFWLYADAGGVVRAVQLERRPSDSPFRTLRWGEDFLLAGPPRRTRPDTVKNRVVVRGANTGIGGAQIWDEWVTGAGDRSHELTFELVEYVNEAQAGAASATGVAKRTIRLWSREPSITEIPRLKADPRLSVGMTVAAECALIGFPSPKPFFIYSLSSTLDRRKGDFSQQLSLDGGTGDQGYTTIPPPEAGFTWRIVRETLDGVGVVELFLDGTSSRSLADGEIVSYAWSTATATALGTPTTATGPRAMFVYPAATAIAEVTLTVTDTSSKTGSYTQAISLAGDELVTPTSRVISLALGAAWAVTPDGGATWRIEATGDSTLVPEQSGTQLLSTRATGSTGLRGTSDALVTASEALAGLGGQITAFSATPKTDRVWAAVGALLHRSIDAGVTFSLWGTLPASITAVLEDPAVPSSVFVLAGADMLHSTLDTPGTSWATLYAGPEGATARHLVRGESGATTWVAYTGTFVGAPLQRVEGPITAVWPLGTSPDVTEVRALALSPDEATVYAWDSQGRGWAVDSETGVATAIAADLASGETAQHALHDPDDAIVYLATFGAVQGNAKKYFPLADALFDFYVPAAGSQTHRIGLGGEPKPPPASLWLLPPSGNTAYYRDGTTWAAVALPETRTDWTRLVASPFDTRRLLLQAFAGSTHKIWVSTDAGATWTVVLAEYETTGGQDTPTVAWSATTADGWISTSHTPGQAHRLVRGVGATAAFITIAAGQPNPWDRFRIGLGLADEVVTNASSYTGNTLSWIDASNTRHVGPVDAGGDFERVPGTRQTITYSYAGGIGASADYRSAPWVLIAGTAGGQGAVLADGTVVVGWRTNTQIVTDAFGAATVSDGPHAGQRVGWVRSDRQTQTTATAALYDTAQIAVRDAGGVWAVVPYPAGVTSAAWIEPVVEAS